MSLQSLQNNCFQRVESKRSFFAVRWIHRPQNSFTDIFFLVVMSAYSILPNKFQRAFKCPFAHSAKKVFPTCLIKKKRKKEKKSFNSVKWIHTSQSSVMDSSCTVFIWEYSIFPHSPQWAPECPFTDFPKRVPPTCWIKRVLILWD